LRDESKSTHEYHIVAESVWKALDPELQQVVVEHQPKIEAPLVVERTELIDVIAKLHDPKTPVDGLHVTAVIGQIVTGTVEVDKIEDVRRDSNVISLKGARWVKPTLSTSVPEIQASRQQLKDAFPCDETFLDGSKIIVGIIDHGCDFSHPNFRKPDSDIPGGATRVLFLWDQRDGPKEPPPAGDVPAPEPYCYGREFTSDAINYALKRAPAEPADPDAPHKFLGYDISHSDHGTSVMDIAAGNGGGKHPPGVAPGADIIFVDESNEVDYMTGDSFGNSRRLLEAVKYVFDKAGELVRPAVVNISLSFEGGPHDGTTLIEEALDRLLETPGRAIVIAADNLRLLRTHIRRTLHPRRTHTVRWRLSEYESNRNKIEFWYSGVRSLSLILRSPHGHEIGPFPLGSTYTIYSNGERAGFVFHRANDPNNGDNHLVAVFSARMETGVWELDLRLLDDGSHLPIEVHAWTVTDRRPSKFPEALATDSTCTINGLGCGNSTIVVGGYNAVDPCDKLDVSSEGPTRDGKLKPEVSAPAVEVRVAQAMSVPNPTHIFDGTSAAAPHVTGLIALLMQSATTPLFIDQIREFVNNTARDDPPSPEHGWDTCYGNGRVDAVAAIRAQRGHQSAAYSRPVVVSPTVSARDVNNQIDGLRDLQAVDLATPSESSETDLSPPVAQFAKTRFAGIDSSADNTDLESQPIISSARENL